jgi:hypothetical protein
MELGGGDGDRLPFVCECDDVSCRALIRLITAEYAEARAGADRCVVAASHPGTGRIVATGQGYVVMES